MAAVSFFGRREQCADQFAAGQPSTLVSGRQQQSIEDGHAVPLLGYNEQYLYTVTWRATQPMAWDWRSTYGNEAWGFLSEEFE